MSGDQIASALQSFLHNKETTTEAAIEATLKLIKQEKSGRSCFLAVYSILQALPILRLLHIETETNNQLVDECRIYLAKDIFITDIEVVAFFNHSNFSIS